MSNNRKQELNTFLTLPHQTGSSGIRRTVKKDKSNFDTLTRILEKPTVQQKVAFRNTVKQGKIVDCIYCM